MKQLAEQHQIPVYQPKSLRKAETQAELTALQADVMVVVAYGLILPQVVLDAPKYGCLNVHGSLLPRWRGAAPIQRAIWAGDAQTGVTTMQMDAGLDTGDMLHKVYTLVINRIIFASFSSIEILLKSVWLALSLDGQNARCFASSLIGCQRNGVAERRLG